MKINSKDLWDYVNNLATDKKTMFKVYCDDIYFTDIHWNGEEFEWKPGQFTSKAFFDPLVDFEPIEKNKKIEKMSYYDYTKIVESTNKSKTIELMLEKHEKRINDMHKKINELIDKINELKEKK